MGWKEKRFAESNHTAEQISGGGGGGFKLIPTPPLDKHRGHNEERVSRANLRSKPAIRNSRSLFDGRCNRVDACSCTLSIYIYSLAAGREREEGGARILIHQTFQFCRCPRISLLLLLLQNHAPDISLSWPVTRSSSAGNRYACVKSFGAASRRRRRRRKTQSRPGGKKH